MLVTEQVEGPNGLKLFEGVETEDNFVNVAIMNGEYSFCWDNSMSRFTKKVLNLEVWVNDVLAFDVVSR